MLLMMMMMMVMMMCFTNILRYHCIMILHLPTITIMDLFFCINIITIYLPVLRQEHISAIRKIL